MNSSKILTDRFPIRAHDLDASGTTSITAFIRLFENQRWDALSENGFLRPFFKNGVIRAQSVEILQPMSFGDTVEISMWLSRVGRTSMDFCHHISSTTTGSEVGRATVRAVTLDKHGRPKPLSKEIRRFQMEQQDLHIQRVSLEPEPSAWSHCFSVRWTDLDLLQHVNEARYIEYIEDTRHACAAASGYGSDSQRAVLPIKHLTISYEDQARLGDSLCVTSWALQRNTNRYAFEIRRVSDQMITTRALVEVAGRIT